MARGTEWCRVLFVVCSAVRLGDDVVYLYAQGMAKTAHEVRLPLDLEPEGFGKCHDEC
jgi:hypothetical protein